MTSMFEVDRPGLRKLLERKGKEFALFELVQNAWDQNVTEVGITFEKLPGSRIATIRVVDDDPDGFADLSHAYTLFAEFAKKANPRQRGRFNIGEKLVIAICEESRILTTQGGVEFIGDNRRTLRRTTKCGSIFEGTIRLTNDEFRACCDAMQRLLPPNRIKTVFNGEVIAVRNPIATIERLPLTTETADDQGFLRRSTRMTELRVFQVREGETAMLYEMGIPVVETGDDYHVDVQQKVPLNVDRDNVPPAFLRMVRTAVLNKLHDQLTPESANHIWVKAALEDPDISDRAVESVIRHRFGDRAVAYDPSDPEANSRAVSNGWNVVHSRNLSKEEWANVRSAGVLPSASSMFPTHPEKVKEPKKLQPTDQEAKMLGAIRRIARVLLNVEIEVAIVSDASFGFAACYGGRQMLINKQRVGSDWFKALDERSLSLIIHELGHELESNHLSDEYYAALTKLGARLALATGNDPSLLVL